MSSPAGAEAVEKSLEPVAEEVERPCGDSTQGSIASGDVQDRQTAKTWPGGMQACVLDLVAARADNGEFPCVCARKIIPTGNSRRRENTTCFLCCRQSS